MATEETPTPAAGEAAAPKPKTKKVVKPYVPPAMDKLVAVAVPERGITVYYDKDIPDAQNAAGDRRIRFYSPDLQLVMDRTVKLDPLLDPEDHAKTLQGQARSFAAKLGAGQAAAPPVEYEDVPITDEPPAAPAAD